MVLPFTLHPFVLCRFSQRLHPCLERIQGVRVLWVEVEKVRAESYSQENEDHERSLMKVGG